MKSFDKVYDHLGVQLAERVGGQLPPGMLEGLGGDIAKVAHTLRWDMMSTLDQYYWLLLILSNIVKPC